MRLFDDHMWTLRLKKFAKDRLWLRQLHLYVSRHGLRLAGVGRENHPRTFLTNNRRDRAGVGGDHAWDD